MEIKQAVIMAGGEGIRLRPFTYMVPKPLLPYGNLTIIEHTIKQLSAYGIKKIYILTSYQNNRFSECLKYQKKYNVKIKLVREKEKMGTIGGLYYLRKELKEPFILMNGDIITKLNFDKVIKKHKKNKSKITICIKDYCYKLPYGILQTNEEGVVKDILEKPEYNCNINAGIYLMEPDLLEYLNGGKIDFTDFFSTIKDEHKIFYYKIDDNWIDLGQVKDYEQALMLLKQVGEKN